MKRGHRPLFKKILKKNQKKGDFGYFNSEKKRRLLITAGLFSLPLLIFFVAWAVNGTRMTVWTVLTVVGCLPGCKSMVSLIMILLRHPMDEKLYKEIRKHAGDLVMSYEMYMTFMRKAVIWTLLPCAEIQ